VEREAPAASGNSAVRQSSLVLAAVAAISILAFLYFFSRGMTNNYGDGLAHVNIARKILDSPDESLWQRYMQIGSPWLPLQTVAMLPLVWNDSLWRTGAAGSIVSMVSFVVAAMMLFMLARRYYRSHEDGRFPILPMIAAGIFVFNPSVLYIQSTPMSELVFIAAFASSVYALQRWNDNRSRGRLAAAGAVMALACLARYEAWPAAAVAVAIVAFCAEGNLIRRIASGAIFGVVAATGPLYWLWHNWAIYDDPFEFLTGPSSARGLYLQNRANLGWSQVFVGNLPLDVGLMAAAVAVCAGPLLLLAATAGLARVQRSYRRVSHYAPALLFGVPFLFHVWSLYRGEIQVFPFSVFGLLNVRYGLPHLPGVALLAPAAILFFRSSRRRGAAIAICGLVAVQYWWLLSDGANQLAVFQEGYRNGVNSRQARDLARVSEFLNANPPRAMILMQSGSLGPLVPRGGLRFASVIHEGTARWHQVADTIPPDVSTVVVEQGDALDSRLRARPALARDLGEMFEPGYRTEKITVYSRVRATAF
jgi:hypothetical protein